MSDNYPFTWAPISPEDDATVKRCYGELGKCRDLVRFFVQGKLSIFMMLKSLSWISLQLNRSQPEMMRVTPSFADHCQRIRDIKVDVLKFTHCHK